MKSIITRRDFMKGTAFAAAGAMVGFPKIQESSRSRVVLVRNEHVWKDEKTLNADIVQEMLDQAITALMQTDNPVDAFKMIVGPDDIVGIKTNVWRMLATPKEMEEAIKRRVIEAGVKEDNIDTADQGLLRREKFLNATAMINVRPLRTHHWSGIGGCLKNLITFVPRPADYHDDSCADMATFWKIPEVNGKVKLNILVVLSPLFHGRGPHHFDQRYIWKYNGILASLDPVAVDAIGLDLLNKKRMEHFGRRRELPIPPKHVMLAQTRHNLGIADLDRIDLIKIGWDKDILI